MPQLRRFWNTFWTKLANEQPYEASIVNMRLRLQELQEVDRKAQELRQQKANGYKKINDILYYQSLPFVPEAIWTELINHHHDGLLASCFGIEKTCKLLAKNYYWPTLCNNIEA